MGTHYEPVTVLGTEDITGNEVIPAAPHQAPSVWHKYKQPITYN